MAGSASIAYSGYSNMNDHIQKINEINSSPDKPDIGDIKKAELADEVKDLQNNLNSTLTDAQKSRLNSLNNTIEHNLKETDFSGTLRDLQGDPVPNPQGGYYDHLTEMKQSYKSLTKIKKGLEGSLKNPNLSNADRAILQDGLDKTIRYIDRIEKLFEPFGGIQ